MDKISYNDLIHIKRLLELKQKDNNKKFKNIINYSSFNININDNNKDDYKNIPAIKGINRIGPLCYLISAIQSLRYLNIDKFNYDKKEIITKIRNGDIDYIKKYYDFPFRESSARDAILKICNDCEIEVLEYFNDIENEKDSKNILIINYYDYYLMKEKYTQSNKILSNIETKNKKYTLKSATFYCPVIRHYITVIFKNDYNYILNDNNVVKIINNKLTTKLSYYDNIYYCECAIYE